MRARRGDRLARILARVAVTLAGTVVGGSAFAAETAPARGARDFSTYQPSAVATRIDGAQAPVIDGDVSDAVWQRAPAIDEFYQLEPKEGAPGSERTVVRVLYDENNLYFSLHAYDSEPDKVTASIKARDGDISKDDVFRIYLDPYMSRRDGYAFEVNPLGARSDALIENNTSFLPEWNTIWSAKARRVADGWMAEVAIPFRSISYDIARGDWGFDLFRLIRRKGERIRWSQIRNQLPSVDISRSGTLQGVAGTAQGLGLDLKLYGSLRYKHEWVPPREDDVRFEPSGNAYYKITPALTGTLTFNTDFSDTPLDARKVNTGRFGLFFPETRDFFLQDASVFEFGGNNLADSVNGRPFFSRNIGLVDGFPVDIVAGGKLSGQIGSLGIGGLIVAAEGTEQYDGQILSAARITQPVFGESELGIVFTNGDPTGLTENTVAGADFQYRNSTWFNGDTFKADFFYERSFSDVYGDDDSFGAHLSYPNQPFSARFQFKEVGENFYPALGFVNRPGIRLYDGNFFWQPRPKDSWVRFFETGTWYHFTTDLENVLETRENGGWFGFMTQETDAVFLDVFNLYENIREPFFLPRDVLVPANEYTWTNAKLYMESAIGRPFAVVGEVECCSYFDGDLLRTYLSLSWRPDTSWEIGAEHSFYNITLPTGDLEIQIWALNVTLNFTPDMQLKTQTQYDNISEAFGLSARYRWEFMPGSEVFVSLGESGDLINGAHYRSGTTQASVRIGHLMRF
ncbi:MAG: carbohydrate binding family 9 domain-containing protein [Alphaproteobacteria bacterium]|nr:carbohydrate binding family 9 domain-containing protein [Alphaproteobacteria bacterium]